VGVIAGLSFNEGMKVGKPREWQKDLAGETVIRHRG
jgi:hypothetical protein